MGISGSSLNTAENFEGRAVSMCRFLAEPFPECYCMNISSKNIHKMLLFCAEDFTSCHIYRSMTAADGAGAVGWPERER